MQSPPLPFPWRIGNCSKPQSKPMHSQNLVSFTHCLLPHEQSSSRRQLPRITQLRKGCYSVHQAIGENPTFILAKQLSLSTTGRKKDRPHLSALHNPAAASKAMFTWEKDTGQTLRAWFPDCSRMQHLETKKITTVAGISQIQDHQFGKAAAWEHYAR